ncbi:hypothetical protein [Ruegeria sp.]|uniref:hypothetical protein n=1 Tax=Ruegeria sp. TaxID=1879320 RepID=UPI003B000012
MKTERRQPWLPGLTPPPRVRRVMMHADDRGQAPGLMPGWRTAKGWLFDMTDSEVRRGVPCPVCNDPAPPPGITRAADHGPLTDVAQSR